MTVLILGIGNTLLSDEGIGVHVVQALRSRHPVLPDVEYMDGGTLSFTLAEPIARSEGLIVVDAARLGGPPGTLHRHEGEAMDRYLRSARGSVHEVGLSDLLDMTRLTGNLPPRRCLIGLEPASLDWGDRPTQDVEAAIPAAVASVLDTLDRWRSLVAQDRGE